MKIQANGDIILINDLDAGSGTTTGTTIGNVANGLSHTVLLTVNLSGGVYSVSIFKSGGNIVHNDHPLLTPDITAYHNPARPSVSFNYVDYHSAHSYVVDEVLISRAN